MADGTIAVAYNVLGSYASARVDLKDAIEIILPSDFPTTMLRTAMVSRDAAHPDAATRFVRHLIALQSRADDATFPLPPLSSPLDNVDRATIALEPALMTFLDSLKRRRFLSEWENAVIQE